MKKPRIGKVGLGDIAQKVYLPILTKYMVPAKEAVKKLAIEKMQLCGSIGKANGYPGR